jgi:ribosomal protein L16/L10AE
MMQPKRTKYRKQFKGRNTGLAQRGNMWLSASSA